MGKKPASEKPTVDPLDARYLFDPSPAHTEFMLARAHAVEEYSNIEGRLAEICAHLMGVEPDISGELFLRMNNARSRLVAIEQLLKKRHADHFSIFWRSLYLELRKLDEVRNSIIHWTVKKTGQSYPGTNGIFWSSLISPKWGVSKENAKEIYRDDLYSFILKCSFFNQLLMNFRMKLAGLAKTSTPDWLQVFLEPVAYPPPKSHPLFRDWKLSGNPPQPSLPQEPLQHAVIHQDLGGGRYASINKPG